jgi:hypothetical protein
MTDKRNRFVIVRCLRTFRQWRKLGRLMISFPLSTVLQVFERQDTVIQVNLLGVDPSRKKGDRYRAIVWTVSGCAS